jgi:hypothetical protein
LVSSHWELSTYVRSQAPGGATASASLQAYRLWPRVQISDCCNSVLSAISMEKEGMKLGSGD